MKLSDALEVYFKENYSSTDFDALFIREVKKLEAIVEGSSELLENNTVGELLAEGLEEIAEDVSKTQEDFSPRKYVVRVTTPHEDGFWYVSKNAPLGSSLSHESRRVFDTLLEAWQVRSDYNNQAYRCRAVVVPDGTEEYCRNAEPVEVNGEE